MSKIMYMHTIAGYPASYWEEEQICFITKYQKPRKVLVSSLKKIKEQQKLSILWRMKQGFDKLPQKQDYSWIKILV